MIRIMHMASLSEEIFVQKINERINMIVSERKLMGLNYHYGIRCMIQKLFRAFDADSIFSFFLLARCSCFVAIPPVYV